MNLVRAANILCLFSGILRLATEVVRLSVSSHEVYVFWLKNLPFFS